MLMPLPELDHSAFTAHKFMSARIWAYGEKLLKRLALLFFYLTSVAAFGKTAVSSISISPQGAVLPTGSSLQFSASCTYADGSKDDCSAAGGATWTSSQTPQMSVSSSGQATWNSDPGSGTSNASGHVVVSAGGFSDYATVIGQHIGDTFYQYPTPDYTTFKDPDTGSLLPLNVAVGATVTMGSGFVVNESRPGYLTGTPFQAACNWTSSNSAVATVDRHGLTTAKAPGTVTITCGRAGNGVFGNASSGTWIAPGNAVTFNVVTSASPKGTWYVRPKGGTPFVNASQTPNGQCDGLHDADYPGQGVNQPCAVSNLRDLYLDGVTHHQQQWMIGGGDTVIVRQKPGGYNVAFDAPYTPTNCDDLACDLPTIPSGTPSQHTRILGENYASCHSDSAKTLLIAYGREAINVRDSQFVDVSCFEITDKVACGPGNFTNASCPSGTLGGGAIGILQSALTSNVSYNDLFIHGLVVEAINGATGVGVVGNYLHIRGMPSAGIDMDDAPWYSSNISVAGGFTLNNSITEFTGCIEEYPVAHNYPYIECRDQETGAYGDGFGTASTTGNWAFDHDIWRYNFQDGLDLLHSGMQSLTITNSQSYGNDGQAYKIGAADTVVFRNNYALVNCRRILSTIGDEPSSAIVPGVNPCRAGGDWIPLNFTDLGTYTVQNNTLVGYGSVPFDLACSGGWGDCSHAKAVYQNNVLLGFSDPSYDGGENPASFYAESASMPANSGWTIHDHNLLYNVRSCPSTLFAGETCNTVDPKFMNQPGSKMSGETDLDSFAYTPAPSSPLIGAGTPIVGLLTDILGNLRPSAPSIGAMETGGSSGTPAPNPQQKTSITLNATPTSLVAGASVTLSASTSSNTSTMPTGTVTFLSSGTPLASGTLNSAGVASFTSASMSPGSYSITASYTGDSNFAPATSSSTTVSVTSPSKQPQPTVTLSVTPNGLTTGQPVTLSASIAGSSNTPSGSVIFSLGGKPINASINSSGVATATIASLAVGNYAATASYGGDSNYSASSSSAVNFTVGAVGSKPKQQTSLTFNATPSVPLPGQAVTFTANAATVSGLVPTGAVNFSLNGVTVSAPLDSNGSASGSIKGLGAGTYSATATYAGDSNFNSGSATPISLTVAPASTVSLSIAQPQAGFNVIPGSTRRIFATVTNGQNNQVAWAVKSGSAQISSNAGSWIDVTAGNTGSSCSLAKTGNAVLSSAQFTIEATSVDDGAKKADVTFNVCNPAVQISTVPAYRTLYSNQNADIQSLVVGSVNDEVQWSISSQPNGGDGKLADTTARDTVFSATVPGRYTLNATSVADGGKSASTILYVTGHNMPYRVTRNATEPVDCSVDPALLGKTYDVGPSQTYHRLKDVPITSMLDGSTVRLHNEDSSGTNPTTYHEYVQLSQHAAADQPIRFCGVPDAAGNLPILDASSAIGRSDVTASAAGNGLVTVGGSTSGAAWPAYTGAQNIVIEGLHLRNANPGASYTTPGGSTAKWQSSAACIRVGDGHNISLIGDDMDSCSNGAASLWNGTTWGGSSLNHLWEGNHIHGSGTSGNNQMYLQGWGEVVQFNRIDQIAAGSNGANLKSRGVQDVIRYNYFGDGPARDMDLVDVQGAAQFMSFGDFLQTNKSPTNSTYSMDQLAAWQEAWNSHFSYGNIYLNSTSLAPIHFAYDQSGAEAARKGNLFWYNNDFYETACSGCSGQLLTLFDTTGGNGSFLPQTEFPTVQAFNNIVWMDSTTQPALQWNSFDAFIGVGADNLLPAGWGANTLQGGTGDGWNAAPSKAAYQNAGSLSLHVNGFNDNNIQTTSSMPFDKTSWILLNATPESANLPASVCEMPTRFTYLPSLGYAVPRTTSTNVGATDTPAQTAALINLVGGARLFPSRSSTCH